MRNASSEFKERMLGGNFYYEVATTFKDGTTHTFTGDELSLANSQIVWSTGSESLPLGNAISGELTLSIINPRVNGIGQWDDVNFLYAKMKVYCCMDNIPHGGTAVTEKIYMQEYTVTEPAEYGDVVTVKGYDAMYKAGLVTYVNNTGADYPTIGQLIDSAAAQSNLSVYDASHIANRDAEIYSIPEGATCRDILGYCALYAGGNVYIDQGTDLLHFRTYTDAFGVDDQEITEYKTLDNGRDDIRITGLIYERPATTDSADASNIVTVTYGLTEDDGSQTLYALKIECDLYTYHARAIIERTGGLGSILVGSPDSQGKYTNGLKFRRFNATVYRNPLFQVMDVVRVIDIYDTQDRPRRFTSILTDVTYNFFGFTEIACNAEDPVKNNNSVSYSSPTMVAIRSLQRASVIQKSAIEQAQEDLEAALVNGSYMTTEVDSQTGASKMFLHDKPNKNDSSLQVTIGAQAIAFRQKVNNTWSSWYGINCYDASLIMENIYAGDLIEANRLRFTGSLTGVGVDNTTNFSVSSDGTLTAKKGSIAGWELSSTQLNKYSEVTEGVAGQTEYRAFIHAPATPQPSHKAFGIATRSYDGTTYGSSVYPFYVTYDGYLYANNAKIKGEIEATSGVIGGYTIGTRSLYSTSADVTTVGGLQYGVRLNNPTDITASTQAIGVRVRTFEGGTTYSGWDYPFYVNYDGFVRCTKGVIGGWTISEDQLAKSTTTTPHTFTSQDLAVITGVLKNPPTITEEDALAQYPWCDVDGDGHITKVDLAIVTAIELYGAIPNGTITRYSTTLNANKPYGLASASSNEGAGFSYGVYGAYAPVYLGEYLYLSHMDRYNNNYRTMLTHNGLEFSTGGKYPNNKNLTDIGSIGGENGTQISLSSGSWASSCSMSLTAGKAYLINGIVSFASNTSGYRRVLISTTAASTSPINQFANVVVATVNGLATRANVTAIYRPSSNVTIYLNVYQNSGSSLNVTGYLQTLIIEG